MARRATIFVLLAAFASLSSAGCEAKPDAPVEAAAPATQTLQFEVVGMHCESCSEAITAKLSKMGGVKAVSVDHESGRAKVEVAGDTPAPEAIVEAIDKLGFEARVEQKPPKPAS